MMLLHRRNVCVVTGTRAEYGLLKPIMNRIKESSTLKLQLVSTGMHLLPEFGYTNKEIKKDGFEIDAEVPIVVGGSTKVSMATSIGMGVISLTQTFDILKPDIILVLGDRFEIFAASIAASYSGRIVAHIHGGDKLQSGYDEYTRHAITKISHIHFPATKKSAERILKMGEEPFRVSVTGSPSIETILNSPLLSRNELFEKLELNLRKKIILLVQHPVSTCPETAVEELQLTLDSVVELGHQVVLIYPNMDPGGVRMIETIKEYEGLYPDDIKSFKSLPFEYYLSLMRHSEFMIGNSSSGIIEAPSFHIPVINIGPRQEGRERSDNVIDVDYNKKEIEIAIEKVLNDGVFKEKVRKCINPYGNGNTSNLICDILEKINIDDKLLIKKITYD